MRNQLQRLQSASVFFLHLAIYPLRSQRNAVGQSSFTTIQLTGIFKTTALLRNNSHIIQFTHLNWTIQWSLAFAQTFATTTSQFQNPVQFNYHSHITNPPSSPKMPLIHLLCLQICQLLTFYMNTIIYYGSICDWLLSLIVMF